MVILKRSLYTNFFFQNRYKSLSPNVENKGVLKPLYFFTEIQKNILLLNIYVDKWHRPEN